jgi:hypothetical protein
MVALVPREPSVRVMAALCLGHGDILEDSAKQMTCQIPLLERELWQNIL